MQGSTRGQLSKSRSECIVFKCFWGPTSDVLAKTAVKSGGHGIPFMLGRTPKPLTTNRQHTVLLIIFLLLGKQFLAPVLPLGKHFLAPVLGLYLRRTGFFDMGSNWVTSVTTPVPSTISPFPRPTFLKPGDPSDRPRAFDYVVLPPAYLPRTMSRTFSGEAVSVFACFWGPTNDVLAKTAVKSRDHGIHFA